MSKSELQSDGTNAGAAASRLRCAKKVLDIHRQFIDDLMPLRIVMRSDHPTLPRDGRASASRDAYRRELETQQTVSQQP